MKLFLDTTDIKEISFFADIGIVDGITTNPSLIAASGRNVSDAIKEICSIVSGPVSAEVIALDAKGMIEEGLRLSELAPNVVIKIPATWDGIKACKHFSERGIMTNVTLCFSALQGLMAAKAGASFVSIFVGRQDDVGGDGMSTVSDLMNVYDQYPEISSEVLVASIRSPLHIYNAANLGAHICTVPPKIMRQLLDHPLTDKGIKIFLQDFKRSESNKVST
jgi:transaldolase